MRYVVTFLVLSLPAIALADAPNPQIDRLWRSKCASCHGVDGKGQTEQGKKMATADMTTAAWQAGITDEQMKKGTLEGFKRDVKGVHQEMEPYKTKITPAQMDGLVVYMRGLKK